MNKKIKFIVMVILFLVLIFLTFYKSRLVVRIASVISLVSMLFTYVYNNWGWLFIWFNKIKAYVFQRTIAYMLSYKFYVSKNTDTEDVFDKLIEEYKKKSNYKRCEYNANKLSIILFSATIIIKINDYSEETKQINLEVSSSVSYRESKKPISLLFDVINFINTIVGPQIDRNYNLSLNIKEQKSDYKAVIELEKDNPFYQYIPKHIESDSKTSFNKMILNERDVEIIIYPHKMIVNTQNKKKLEKVLNNYIPISTI